MVAILPRTKGSTVDRDVVQGDPPEGNRLEKDSEEAAALMRRAEQSREGKGNTSKLGGRAAERCHSQSLRGGGVWGGGEGIEKKGGEAGT